MDVFEKGIAQERLHFGGTSGSAQEKVHRHFVRCRARRARTAIAKWQAFESESHPRPGKKLKPDAKAEARLIAEACSTAPEGRKQWTLHSLADRVVELKLAYSYSHESVRNVLKKMNSSRG